MNENVVNISEIIHALQVIKAECAKHSCCEDCSFTKSGSCYIKQVDPEDWKINGNYIWRAFK